MLYFSVLQVIYVWKKQWGMRTFWMLSDLQFSPVCSQSETKLYNGSDKDVSASGGKLTKKESLKVKDLKLAPLENTPSLYQMTTCLQADADVGLFRLLYRLSWSLHKTAILANSSKFNLFVCVAGRCRRKTTERRRRGPRRSCSAPSRTPRSSSWPTGWRWECECAAQLSFYMLWWNIHQVRVKYNTIVQNIPV